MRRDDDDDDDDAGQEFRVEPDCPSVLRNKGMFSN